MDPMTDIDRAIRDALRVEPSAHFASRIRARVAERPIESRIALAPFALAIAGAVVLAFAASLWRPDQRLVTGTAILPSRDLLVMSPASAVPPSPAVPRPSTTAPDRIVVADVQVSPSEMLALQQLFAGITVAPPSFPAPADELSIQKLEIEPLQPLAGGPEGERQ